MNKLKGLSSSLILSGVLIVSSAPLFAVIWPSDTPTGSPAAASAAPLSAAALDSERQSAQEEPKDYNNPESQLVPIGSSHN